MEDCGFRREEYCNKISLKVDARFFWANMIALGDYRYFKELHMY